MISKSKPGSMFEGKMPILMIVILVSGFGQSAFADLIIWQVESNPPGDDAGKEWVAVLNTGKYEELSGYEIREGNVSDRDAWYLVPDVNLGQCEYFKYVFPTESLGDGENKVNLYRDLFVTSLIHSTGEITDFKDDDYVWVNPNEIGCEPTEVLIPADAYQEYGFGRGNTIALIVAISIMAVTIGFVWRYV